jgi:hypothetical protein
MGVMEGQRSGGGSLQNSLQIVELVEVLLSLVLGGGVSLATLIVLRFFLN